MTMRNVKLPLFKFDNGCTYKESGSMTSSMDTAPTRGLAAIAFKGTTTTTSSTVGKSRHLHLGRR